MKFAHMADVHLGGWKQPELQEINSKSFKMAIDNCIKEKVKFALVAGDLFDTAFPGIEVLKETFSEFKRLKEAGIPCFIIAGSHDYSVSGKTFLDVLEKAGFCNNVENVEEKNGFLTLVKKDVKGDKFLTLPFYGLANCGPALVFADDRIEGYIKISKKVFDNKNLKNIYLIKASGNSMNLAQIGPNKKKIEDGDFIVADAKIDEPRNGDYVVSIIDGCANIKKFRYNPDEKQVLLLSESTDEYFPIVLHESDNLHVVAKVVDVIKLSSLK